MRSLIAKRQASEPLSYSARIAFFAFVCAGFSIFSMYRATLVAFLAAEENNPPVHSLKELINSDYSLAVQKGTSMEARFLNSAPQSDEYQLNNLKKIKRFY